MSVLTSNCWFLYFFLVFHSPAKWVSYSSFILTYFTHVHGVDFITLTGQRSDYCHIWSLPCVGSCKILFSPQIPFSSISIYWNHTVFMISKKMLYANFVFMHSVFLVWSCERIYKLPVDIMLSERTTQHITWSTDVIWKLFGSVFWDKWSIT